MVFKARMGNGKVIANHFFWKTGLKTQDRAHGMEREPTKGPKVVFLGGTRCLEHEGKNQ